MKTLQELAAMRCQNMVGQSAMSAMDANAQIQALPGWQVASDGLSIGKTFTFPDFHRTMAFINAMAWIANVEDHHPDFEAGYNRCVIRFNTHDVGGVSINDFVCAAKVEMLFV